MCSAFCVTCAACDMCEVCGVELACDVYLCVTCTIRGGIGVPFFFKIIYLTERLEEHKQRECQREREKEASR